MSKQIAAILKQVSKDVLSEEVLKEIQSAFEKSVSDTVSLHVSKALNEQDEDYAKKLESLLETIDNDHTVKLGNLIKNIDKSHSKKLGNVINKFEKELNESARKFKKSTTSKISDYMDLYLEKTIPKDQIKQAVQNKQAKMVLEKVKSILGINDIISNKKVREGIVDGKNKLNESSEQIKKLANENKLLKEQVESTKREILLEKKTVDLDSRKKKFICNMFEDKTIDFINENFDYALRMFDKTESKRVKQLKDEVLEERVANKDLSDVVKGEDVIEEGVNDNGSSYVAGNYMLELQKY